MSISAQQLGATRSAQPQVAPQAAPTVSPPQTTAAALDSLPVFQLANNFHNDVASVVGTAVTAAITPSANQAGASSDIGRSANPVSSNSPGANLGFADMASVLAAATVAAMGLQRSGVSTQTAQNTQAVGQGAGSAATIYEASAADLGGLSHTAPSGSSSGNAWALA